MASPLPSSNGSVPDDVLHDSTVAWCDLHSSTVAYADRFSGAVGSWLLEVQARCLKALLSESSSKTVLDVGGGHGQVLRTLEQSPYQLSLYTSSIPAIGIAAPLVEKHSIPTFHGPLFPLPFADRSFDTVISLRTVTHIPHWQSFLAELARVAKNQVIIDYPTTRSVNIFSSLLFEKKRAVEKNTRPFTVFKDSEIRAVLRRGDLTEFSQLPQFFFPMAAHRALGLHHCSASLEAVARTIGLTQLAGSPVILSASRPS